MVKSFLSFVIFILFSACVASSDIEGDQLAQVDQRNLRVISLAPHITELFFEVGAGQSIVGTVEYSNYPEQAKLIKRIGDYHSISIEAVMALKPDFVVAIPGSAMGPQITKLEKLGIDVRFSDPENASEVAEQMIRIGAWMGHERQAKERAESFLSDWNDLKNKYQVMNQSNQKKPRVFFQAWLKPLMTLNRHNLINEVIELCGGENVFAGLPMAVPQVSIESVIQKAPGVIIYSSPQPMAEVEDYWQQWPSIPAVERARVGWIHADHLARPVPEIIKGAKSMCQHIHGL